MLDEHRAQRTQTMLADYKEERVTSALVSDDCTSLVQSLDVCFNKSFKNHIKETAIRHYDENVDAYTKSKIFVSERRILMTK